MALAPNKTKLVCTIGPACESSETLLQMLESMVDHYRPTRAEATDVANAILDGTDCVMLSEESAMGKFPVEAVSMLARIAAATEPYRTDVRVREAFADYDRDGDVHLVDLISRNVQHTVARLAPTAVIVPTATGYTARMVSRFKDGSSMPGYKTMDTEEK